MKYNIRLWAKVREARKTGKISLGQRSSLIRVLCCVPIVHALIETSKVTKIMNYVIYIIICLLNGIKNFIFLFLEIFLS